jgi:hypothetical protein
MATQTEINFMYGVGEAVKKLRPNSIFTLYNRNFIEWDDKSGASPPAWEEVETQIELDKAEYNKTQYARDRKEEYGSAEEQIDALWHEINSGKVIDQNSHWFQTRKKIKEKYPK